MRSTHRTIGMASASGVALCTLLSACGTTTTTSAAAKPVGHKHRVVHITYWAGHSSGALYQAVKAEVRQFNLTHPDIQVTFHPIGASHHGLAAFEAGQAPNVGMLSEWIVPQLIYAGAIVKLNPWMRGPNGLTEAQIKKFYCPVVWNDMKEPNGAQYLMPLEKKSLVVGITRRRVNQHADISGTKVQLILVARRQDHTTVLDPRP